MTAQAQIVSNMPFFPGAEGYGGNWSGTAPAGGWLSNATVYRVTTTADDPGPDGKGAPGTLRGAFRENTTNKIIIFDVAGTFNLSIDNLDIKNLSNYYIAGQTAPGPVTVYNDMVQLTHSSGKENRNVVLRYMSFRKGTGDNSDSITFAGSGLGTNLILDHVSASWSEDEILSVANNNTNVTVQYSLIHDALVNNHAYGSLIRPRISSNVTFHHNLYANNASRQARFGTYDAHLLTADFRNNVVYNWRDRASYAGGSSDSEREFADINFVGNYFIAGPGTNSNLTKSFIVDQNVDARVYQSGNFIDSDKQLNPGGQPNGADTGWNQFQVASVSNPARIGVLTQMGTPFPTPAVTTQSANDAYWQLINHVGNWWWNRDAIDSRVINNVLTNTANPIGGAAPPPAELNGLLTAPTTSHPAGYDTDGDGMPDWWEVKHGLNPSLAGDWNQDFDNDGYINLIEFINERGEFPAPAPIVFNGGLNNRYAHIMNWKTNDGGISAGSNWQPSKYDEAQINSGTVVVDAVGQRAGLLKIGATAGSNGHLQLNSGWLEVADTVLVGAHESGQGTLTLGGGQLVAQEVVVGFLGQLRGTGTLLGNVTNNGVVLPGTSPGTMTIDGDYRQSATGVLSLELASPISYDKLVVQGDVEFDGLLEVVRLGDYQPAEGATFDLIDWTGAKSGFFASLSLPTLSDGLTWDLSLLESDGILSVMAAAPPVLVGDYNNDGRVDAGDYVRWRNALAGIGTIENETESPGEVDELDYAAWKGNYGAPFEGSGGLAGRTSAVPEPGGLAFVLSAAGALATGLRNRRSRLRGRRSSDARMIGFRHGKFWLRARRCVGYTDSVVGNAT